MRDQPIRHVAGLILGTRHQNGPAVQRARFPPAQLAALGDHLADGDDQRSGEGASALVERGQRRLDGALLAGGAVDGDGGRGLRGQAVLGECTGGLGEMTRGGVEHKRSGSGSECRPIDLSADVGLGVSRTQRHTRVARHSGRRGQSRDDLELHLGAGNGIDLGQHRIGGQGVACHQPDDVVAVLGGGDESLGDLGGITQRGTHIAHRVVCRIGTGPGSDSAVGVLGITPLRIALLAAANVLFARAGRTGRRTLR